MYGIVFFYLASREPRARVFEFARAARKNFLRIQYFFTEMLIAREVRKMFLVRACAQKDFLFARQEKKQYPLKCIGIKIISKEHFNILKKTNKIIYYFIYKCIHEVLY